MAQRPVFTISSTPPFYQEESVSFQYFRGFSESQKRKNISSLHSAYLSLHPSEKILEISSKSPQSIGVQLSSFNLMVCTLDNKTYSVECAFQSSKVFENGGPFKDLLNKSSKEAKTDIRLRQSGKLKHFYFSKKIFPLEPKNYFYNWLYINTLNLHKNLATKLMDYTAFTDIEFNPNKSVNCQACSAAIYVSLKKNNLLNYALESHETFLNIVYQNLK